MFEFTPEELGMFLADKPFYKNSKCFCFGKTLEEAGAVVRQLMQEGGSGECGNGSQNEQQTS